MIYVCGPKDPRRPDAINTTSTSKTWSRELSPFFLGPVYLYGFYSAKNIENAWQYTKCYEEYVKNGNPTPEYFEWAKKGWKSPSAHRYPMGKGAKPLFSFWEGQKLTYVEARKKIYIPLYSRLAVKTQAYQILKKMALEGDIWLWDFDGYNHHKAGMTLEQVRDCPYRKMGHAFVLAMMLEKFLASK